MTANLLPPLTFVFGGAASGKSAFAEKLVVNSLQPRVYIATSQAGDDEMRNKIFRHQSMRGPDWITVEAPFDLGPILAGLEANQVVLIDCLTMWLSNHLLAGHDLEDRTRTLLEAFDTCPARLVLVSNDVGQGIVPENALSRQFRDAQGKLNQVMAAKSDLVVTIMAGLPLVLKGNLPEMSA